MSRLRFHLHSAGVLAPGLASLADLRAACRSGQPPEAAAQLLPPGPAVLPPNDRRRASHIVRLTLACIEQALQASPFPVEMLRSVFATDEGTGEVCQQMLEALTTTRQVSPLLFANSVHNAPSGYFSIAWRNRQSATVVSMGLESFASGLLCAVTEATATRQPILLVAYDPAMSAPLDELLSVTESTATAWILNAEPPGMPMLGSFILALEPSGVATPTPLPAWLPQRWSTHSSAHALAALGLLDAAPDMVRHLKLGGQLLSLRRVDGGAA
ncbi:MAG: beta-ketoacyl synthase chain length factor [Thiobacillus sp.]